MQGIEILEFHIDKFCLKASVLGGGSVAIVIGSHKYYQRTFSENLTKKLRLVFVDTRAFSSDDCAYSEADFALDKIVQDIEVIRKSLKNEKVIIIGHSIHAFIALEYAQRFPDKVSHLLLIASSPIAGSEVYQEADRYFEESVCPKRKILFENAMQNFIQSDDKSFVARMLAFGPRLWYDAIFDASALWEGVEVNSIGAGIIWGSMFVGYDVENALKSIKCPILLVLGRYDYFNPPHLWERYREYCSDLTIRVFEESAHTPQLEESENFDNELIDWLERKT